MSKITVRNQEESFVWEKSLSYDEYRQVKRHIHARNHKSSFATTLLIPVRTNNGKNLAIDLFIPIFGNVRRHYELDGLIMNPFQITASITIDFLTLPARLTSCIPRIVWNKFKGEHPFHTYLRNQNLPKDILDSDCVDVKLEGPHKLYPNESINELSNSRPHYRFISLKLGFIALPFLHSGGEYYYHSPRCLAH